MTSLHRLQQQCSILYKLHTIYLMFGHKAWLPVDIMYRPMKQAEQSCAELLQTRIHTAFDLVKKHVTKEHQYQTEFYDWKIHRKPYKTGDLVWLHSPVPKKNYTVSFTIPGPAPLKYWNNCPKQPTADNVKLCILTDWSHVLMHPLIKLWYWTYLFI